jgi:lipopolysaccharide/colanic/teichoic acid biosynthesis glycosyltransferase
VKRFVDLLLVVVAAPIWIPLLAGLALIVRLQLGSPVLFTQRRPGLHGRPFMLVKFRTMTEVGDSGQLEMPDSERLTRFGHVLRATSLDELPELWNVLRGEMSLVGPRPLLMEYLPLYTPLQARRHEVRPGITGWAQISGRNAIRWDDRFALDVWYVDHHSLWLDLRILAMTIVRVVRREGISQEGHATVQPFRGSTGT